MRTRFWVLLIVVLFCLTGLSFGQAKAATTTKLIAADQTEIAIEGVKVKTTDGKVTPLQEYLKTAQPVAQPPERPQAYDDFLGILGQLAKLVVLAMLLERALAFVFELRLVRMLLPKDDELAARDPLVEPLSEYERKVQKGGPWAWFPATVRGLVAGSVAVSVCGAYRFNVFAALFPEAREGQPEDAMGILLTGLILAGGSSAAIALFQGVLGFSKQARDGMVEAKFVAARVETANAKADLAAAEQRKAEAEKNQRVSELAKLAAEREIEQGKKPGTATLSATAQGGGKVALALEAAGATRFTLYSMAPGTAAFAEAAKDVAAKSYVLTGLAPGPYQFKAAGKNADGLGPESTAVTVTVS